MTELNRPQQNPVKQKQGDQRPGRPDADGKGNPGAQLQRDPEDEIEARANLQKQSDKDRRQS